MKAWELLLFALFLKMVTSQQAYDCKKGCMKCTSDKGCIQCFNTKLVPKWATSLTELNQGPVKYDCVPQDANDRCTVYALGNSPGQIVCNGCKPGYVYNIQTNSCDENPKFQNCLLAFKNGDQAGCYLCSKSYPNNDGSQCINFPSPPTGRMGNCDAANASEGQARCIICSAGYSEFKGFCVTTPSNLAGCIKLTDDGNNCFDGCNPYQGYYNVIADSQICTKM